MKKDLFKKIRSIKENDRFLITATIFNKKSSADKNLDTFLFVNKFPYEDIESTKKMIVKLINDIKKEK